MGSEIHSRVVHFQSTFGLFLKSEAVGGFTHDFKHAEFSGGQKNSF